MESKVLWTGNLRFLGTSGSNHSVVMDASEKVGGEGTAASPMEMVLMGFAGCSGIDVVMILEKKRIDIDHFEVRLSAERAEEHPRVFNKIKAEFVFGGKELSVKALEDTVRLSVEKYCSVAGMLDKTAEIDWSVTVE